MGPMVTRGNFARLGPRGYALVALIALFGAFASAAPALASKTGYSDIVEFGENITVPAGKDVGDVVDFGGDERVYGHVHGDAVVFDGRSKHRIQYSTAQELLAQFDTDIVFIEGFKSAGDWPCVELNRNERRSHDDLLAIVDRI